MSAETINKEPFKSVSDIIPPSLNLFARADVEKRKAETQNRKAHQCEIHHDVVLLTVFM